jgi:hypothetical protein
MIERPFSGKVKIGYSKNLERRRRELQTGSSQPLVIYGLIKGATKKTERDIHQQYHEYRRAGEWFDMTLEQVDEIMRQKKGG